MSDRRRPVKAALLVAPLLLSILALHAWGDSMAGGLGRAVGSWQYPQRVHSQFLIRVPRWSDADVLAARALEDFVSHAVKFYGVPLAIQVPAQPVTVVLLDPDTDVSRFGSNVVDDLSPNEGVFDASRRMILVRMERKLQMEPVIGALRQAAARVLLHDAGSARWSPWLTEGLVGRLEGSSIAPDRRAWTGELPGVAEILSFTDADFHGHNRAICIRAARQLAAFLMERMQEKFILYYREEQAGLHPPFSERIGDPRRVEQEWREWLQQQK
jgi:hypothetical protein